MEREDKVEMIFDPLEERIVFKSEKFEYSTDIIKKNENFRIMVATKHLD